MLGSVTDINTNKEKIYLAIMVLGSVNYELY